jgi:hypothetical protein
MFVFVIFDYQRLIRWRMLEISHYPSGIMIHQDPVYTWKKL